jgi:hypothetical protein
MTARVALTMVRGMLLTATLPIMPKPALEVLAMVLATARKMPDTTRLVLTMARDVLTTARTLPMTARIVPITARNMPVTAYVVPVTARMVPMTACSMFTTAHDANSEPGQPPSLHELPPVLWQLFELPPALWQLFVHTMPGEWGGGGGDAMRPSQSTQSLSYAQIGNSEPEQPSSHSAS